jgi:hypothetical protein
MSMADGMVLATLHLTNAVSYITNNSLLSAKFLSGYLIFVILEQKISNPLLIQCSWVLDYNVH